MEVHKHKFPDGSPGIELDDLLTILNKFRDMENSKPMLKKNLKRLVIKYARYKHLGTKEDGLRDTITLDYVTIPNIEPGGKKMYVFLTTDLAEIIAIRQSPIVAINTIGVLNTITEEVGLYPMSLDEIVTAVNTEGEVLPELINEWVTIENTFESEKDQVNKLLAKNNEMFHALSLARCVKMISRDLATKGAS